MITKKLNSFLIYFSLILIIAFCGSCKELSELGGNPFVMATAARYNETTQSPTLLKFTIVYWSDDISGLEINIYTPAGDLATTWTQPSGVLSSGTPVVIDGFSEIVGGWRLTFKGTVATNNDNRGKEFEDEVIVNVSEQ